MFDVTEAAITELAAYFNGKEQKPVRVFLHQGGCGGPQLVMALDDKKESDSAFDVKGIEFLVDNDFFKAARPLKVDYTEAGFAISSSLELGGGCSGCSTTGSCCS